MLKNHPKNSSTIIKEDAKATSLTEENYARDIKNIKVYLFFRLVFWYTLTLYRMKL